MRPGQPQKVFTMQIGGGFSTIHQESRAKFPLSPCLRREGGFSKETVTSGCWGSFYEENARVNRWILGFSLKEYRRIAVCFKKLVLFRDVAEAREVCVTEIKKPESRRPFDGVLWLLRFTTMSVCKRVVKLANVILQQESRAKFPLSPCLRREGGFSKETVTSGCQGSFYEENARVNRWVKSEWLGYSLKSYPIWRCSFNISPPNPRTLTIFYHSSVPPFYGTNPIEEIKMEKMEDKNEE
ncbi:hypothetical protein CDAR_381871 [Caerostris darwini]|uniref:Uncharacterized protein n=1 Tax=Caerostris darwini TaxID=1538125 RepID=A0AAV4V5H7_9ARAC|nr:hypothetical protein CDAR_381871 [Caerostris darwini]